MVSEETGFLLLMKPDRAVASECQVRKLPVGPGHVRSEVLRVQWNRGVVAHVDPDVNVRRTAEVPDE